MPFFKLVWQFSSPPAGYWNEVLHWEGSSLEVAATFLPVGGGGLIDRRLKLLHPVNKLKKIRVSEVDAPRKAATVTVNAKGTYPHLEESGPANLDEAAVVNLASTAVGANRKVWMRGITESNIIRWPESGETKVAPTFLDFLNNWIAKLQSDGYVILTKERVGVTNPERVVQSIASALNPAYTALTLDALPVGLAVGVPGQDMVLIHQADPKLFPGLNGKWRVVAINGMAITINYRLACDPGDHPGYARGLVHLLKYRSGAVINASASGFGYLGSRRSKNVDTGSRGHRRAVRLRR